MLLDPVDPEIVGDRAAGQDEHVVGHRRPAVQLDASAVHVDARGPGHQDLDVALLLEHPAYRPGDVIGVEPGGGDLIQQRLEGVEVVGVDDGDAHGLVGQPLHQGEATESGTDHDDSGNARRPSGLSSGHS
ncbi:MAG: hypothetical protein R2705_23675 [Ilumatobacteraceae bacterium]